MVTIALIGVAAALLAIQFKSLKTEYGIYITLAACIIIFFYSISKLSTIINLINEITEGTTIHSSYIVLLVKIVGITYIAEFSADICKDCGYNTVSNQMQIFGKLTVLSLSVPIIETLIKSIGDIL